VHHKRLTVFEIGKPACTLGTNSMLTIVMYSDWSLIEMEPWSMEHHIAAVELFIKTKSVTATQRDF